MSEDLVYICEICQTVLDEHHCKAVCPNCGRMFDCSDLPIMQANGRVREDNHELELRPGAENDLLPKAPQPGAHLTTPPAPPRKPKSSRKIDPRVEDLP